MDLREQDERYSSGQRSRTCAATLKILAVIGVLVALAVVVVLIAGGNARDRGFLIAWAVLFVFVAFATAAFLWAMATVLRMLRHVEENTRARRLEKE